VIFFTVSDDIDYSPSASLLSSSCFHYMSQNILSLTLTSCLYCIDCNWAEKKYYWL